MSQITYSDSVSVEETDLYVDTRTDDTMYRVVYTDDDRTLLRSNVVLQQNGQQHYKTEFTDTLAEQIGAGRYESADECPESPVMPGAIDAEEQVWDNVTGVGEKTYRKLLNAGIETDFDLKQRDDDDLVDIETMSEAKLKRLKDYANVN
jgi:hypothetical protein